VNKTFNSKATKAVFRNIWKPDKGVVIRDLDKNLFPFQFFSTTHKEFVLNEGPWAFDGKILLLQEINGSEIPSKVEFKIGQFWVKAYDLPAKKQTMAFAQCLAKQLGSFVSCEDSTMFGVDKALCFRVDIDVTKPLHRGVNVMGANGLVWVKVKYVELPDFCYGSGKLGHVLKSCNIVDPYAAEEDI